MKHILPVLTITTLAAAASAQSAAASSGLSYNSVSATYSRISTSGVSGHTTDYTISAQALIGSSNFVVAGASSIGGTEGNRGTDSASLGYLFKNVGGIADATVFVASNDTVGVLVRKDIGNNFEVSAFYARDNGNSENNYGISVGYTLNKVYSLDLGYAHNSSNAAASQNVLSAGLRYNF
jgi:hypothetical protein